MTKINLLALGGLDEKNKNLFVIEINSKIFILDAGIYEPLNNNFGIQHIIPKLDYLKINKDKVKGIFLSSSNRQEIYTLNKIVELIPNINIFGSKETLEILGVYFGDNVIEKWNLNVLYDGSTSNFGDIKVSSFELNSSIPGTLGFAFDINNKSRVLYLTNYIFNIVTDLNLIDKLSLNSLTSDDNLILISDSLNLHISDSIASNIGITKHLWNVNNLTENVLISLYEEEIVNVIELINFVNANKMSLCIVDKDMKEIINRLIALDRVPNIELVETGYSNKETKTTFYLLTGTKSTLYSKIEEVIINGITKDLVIDKSFTFLNYSPPQSGNEHHYQEIYNRISVTDARAILLSDKEKISIHPTKFDLKNYLSIIKPKYLVPIKGYFKEMVEGKKAAMSLGMDEKNIIIKENGVIFTFSDGNYIENDKKLNEKDYGSKVIESANLMNVDDRIILERQSLNKDGILAISLMINESTKKIISNIDLQMKGVIFVRSQEKLFGLMNNIITKHVEANSTKWNHKTVTSSLKKELIKLLRQSIKKTPEIFIEIREIKKPN